MFVVKRCISLGLLLAAVPVAFAQFYPFFPPPQYGPPPPAPYGYYPGQQYGQPEARPERQEGEDVRQAQVQLKSLGLLRGSADGIAGPNTRSALANFQAQNGLVPDGVLGAATKRALERRAGPVAAEDGAARPGDPGLAVRRATPGPDEERANTRPRPAAPKAQAQVVQDDDSTAAPAPARAAVRETPEATESSDSATSPATAAEPASAVPAAARSATDEPTPASEKPVPLDNVPAAAVAPKTY